MVPYRLIPTYDVECPFEIEILRPLQVESFISVQSDETMEILEERVIFEETNPFAVNEAFSIDDKFYFLIKLPHDGHTRWVEIKHLK
tara:strand:- start:1 stop:261 length:261 start_codon:yes stop_codon:yes gene_type:complete